jgi:hypothetical protein
LQRDDWELLTDPGTKQAVLAHFPFTPDRLGEAHWISLETLADGFSSSVPRWNGAALVGDSIILNQSTGAAQIIKDDEQPKTLCANCVGVVRAGFGRGLIFIGRFSYTIADTKGAILYHKKSVGGRADTVGDVSGALTGNRVAFLYGHLGQGLEDTVVVLDVDRKKEVARFELHQQAEVRRVGGFIKESFTTPGLALSPDGKKLAVLVGSVVSLFDIP